jgi:site-specific recombinase XerD
MSHKTPAQLEAEMAAVMRRAAASSAAAAVSSSSGYRSSKQQKVVEWIARNRNAGTSRTYASGWAGFARYLQQEGVAAGRVQECDVADYLRWRVEELKVSAATIAADRAAIADHFKHTALKGVTQGGMVSDMVAVLRTKAQPSKPKMHMSAELMREIIRGHDATCEALPLQQRWIGERNMCMMLVMLMGFLRESEAAALTTADLGVKTVEVKGGSKQVLHVTITKSKTDQARVGAVVLLGGNAAEPALCPVRRYERFLQAREAAGVVSDMLFPANSGVAMSASTPCGIVKRAVQAANEEAEKNGFGANRWGDAATYGSHSMRRGGVTTARANGVSMLDIQRHGRWKSLVVFSYVGQTPEEQLAVTNAFLGPELEGGSGGEAAAAAAAAPKGSEVVGVAAAQLQRARSNSGNSTRSGTTTPSGSGSGKKLKAKSPKGSAKRKRSRTDDDDEEEDSQEQQEEAAVEDLLFAEECSQGYGEAAASGAAAAASPASVAVSQRAAAKAGNARRKGGK